MKATEYPRWVVLQLLDACNLRCRMCYEWGEQGSYHHMEPSVLPFDVVCQVVRECLPGRPFFELFGGEPFLHPRIGDVIKLIGETGCVLGIPTNGTLLEPFTDVLVGDAPIRLWVSLDGPEEINDRQRGSGSFSRACAGLERLHLTRSERGCAFPQLGVTCIVTPQNYEHIERFFLQSIELSKLDFAIIVLQNFATAAECDAYEAIVQDQFGGTAATHARGYVQEPDAFSEIDCHLLSQQIETVRDACQSTRVLFLSHPMETDADTLSHYFAARWHEMKARRSRCAFPWMYAEVSARGDVSTCHSLYDITVGNVLDRSFLDIWNGEAIHRVRDHLRGGLFPICTACCRYFNPTSALVRGLDESIVATPLTAASTTEGRSKIGELS